MEAAVQCGPVSLGLAPPSDPIRVANMDDDAAISPINFGAPASSHEDDDTKESDRWKLHSDTSTISSRVTTPDPVVSSPRSSIFASIGNRAFQRGIIPSAMPSQSPPPPASTATRPMDRGRGRGYGRGRGRGRVLPRSPNVIGAARHRPNPTASPRNDPPHSTIPTVNWTGLPPPPLPPLVIREKLDHGDSFVSYRPHSPPSHLSPPLRRLARGGREGGLGNGIRHQSSQTLPTPTNTSQVPQPIPRPQVNSARPLSSRVRQNVKKSQSFRRQSNDSETESLSLSLARPEDDVSSSSVSSSDEDPITYRNSRQFPPRLPASQVYGASVPRSRSSATNQISAWVSRYEMSRSPARSGERSMGFSHPRDDNSYPGGSFGSQDSSHDEVEILWQQLKQKRAKLSDTKGEMRSRRREMREKRREKDAADNAFMKVVRPMLVDRDGSLQSSTELLEPRLENMQRLRDDYQILESSYEHLEILMDDEERELSILETRFFSILAAGHPKEPKYTDKPIEHGAATTTPDIESTMPIELRGISPYGPKEEPHPLYADLSSAVGDLGNVRDEYADLLSTKEQYEEDIELKKKTGRKVADESERDEFFEEFPSEELMMRDAMQRCEDRVNHLKKLCEEKGVMKKHISVKMEYALDPHMKYEDMDLDSMDSIMARPKTLAHPEFNELLSQPDYVLANPEPLTPLGALKAATMLPNNHPEKGLKKRLAAKEFAIESLMRDCDGGKKADYVNRWLLHQLRLSPLNALLLRSTFVASRSLKIRDMWRWQCDVMHYWWSDKTMSLIDSAFNPITSNNSEYSSRLGTPQMSRAASDGLPRATHQHHHHVVDNSDAITVHG